MSARGDRERDLATLERELAYENRRMAAQAVPDVDQVGFERLAKLHQRAAELLEELADVYDGLDTRSVREALDGSPRRESNP